MRIPSCSNTLASGNPVHWASFTCSSPTDLSDWRRARRCRSRRSAYYPLKCAAQGLLWSTVCSKASQSALESAISAFRLFRNLSSSLNYHQLLTKKVFHLVQSNADYHVMGFKTTVTMWSYSRWVPLTLLEVDWQPRWQQKRFREYSMSMGIVVEARPPFGAPGLLYRTDDLLSKFVQKKIAEKHLKITAPISEFVRSFFAAPRVYDMTVNVIS